MELISIIIPIYNQEKYLRKCLDSILNQTYKNFEAILIDDGSTDSSPELCDKFAKEDDRIKVIHKVNAGVSETRNLGISIAKGEYICFIDSDDYIESTYLQDMYNVMEQEKNCDIVFCKYNIVDSEGNVQPQKEENLKEFVNMCDITYFYESKKLIPGFIWRSLYSKNIIGDLRFEKNIPYLEDVYFLTQLLLAKKPKLGYCDKHLYNYVTNFSSISRKIDKNYANKYNIGVEYSSRLLKEYGYNKHALALEYESYKLGIITKCRCKEIKYSDLDALKYNTKDRYKAHKELYNDFKSRLYAFLARHKLIFLIKLINKLK